MKLLSVFIVVLLFGVASAHNSLLTPIAMQVQDCSQTWLGGINALTINALAPWYCSQINQAVYNNWVSWLPIALLIVMASFSIATLLFIFGVAFRSERVKNFGVGELYEATASLIIVCSSC